LIWKDLGSELSAPPDLCQQALAFYTYYKQQELWPIEKASLVFRVAYFLSEKSQTLYDSEVNQCFFRDAGSEEWLYQRILFYETSQGTNNSFIT
jgi:hypothetical protein